MFASYVLLSRLLLGGALVAVVVVVVALVRDASPRIDGSSPEVFERSVAAARAYVAPEQREQFDRGLRLCAFGDVSDPVALAGAEEVYETLQRTAVHGKSALDVLEAEARLAEDAAARRSVETFDIARALIRRRDEVRAAFRANRGAEERARKVLVSIRDHGDRWVPAATSGRFGRFEHEFQLRVTIENQLDVPVRALHCRVAERELLPGASTWVLEPGDPIAPGSVRDVTLSTNQSGMTRELRNGAATLVPVRLIGTDGGVLCDVDEERKARRELEQLENDLKNMRGGTRW